MSVSRQRRFGTLALLLIVSATPNARGASVAVWLAGAGNSAIMDEEIAAGGRSRKTLADLSQTNLLDVSHLFLINPSNSGYAPEITNFAGDLHTFIFNGGSLYFYDRAVLAGAKIILPSSADFSLTRSFTNANNIGLLPDALVSSIYSGFTDTSFDDGNFSSHGYAAAASLGAAYTYLSIQGEPTKVVEFSYSYGSGKVMYSTIPAGGFLDGGGPLSMQDTISLQVTRIVTIPEPGAYLYLGLAMTGLLCRRRRRGEAKAKPKPHGES